MKPNQKTSLIENSRLPTVCLSSTMLVLQQDAVWWLKVHDGKIVDHHFFELDGASDVAVAETLFPKWRNDESQNDVFYVDLVLDTTIDEVDRVGVPSSGSKIIDRYRQQKTLKRLRNDFPHALVYPLSSYTDERAALMHPVVPDAWSDCLLRIQACNVVIQRAVTSTQLGCHWSSRFTGYVLLNMPSASRSRHVIVKHGAALFLRTMRVLSQESADLRADEVASEAGLSELNQTIEYILSRTSLATQPVFIVEPICAHASSLIASQDQKNSRACSDNAAQDLTQALSPSVYCLFSMFYDQPVQYRSRLMVSATQLSALSDKSDSSAIGIECKASRFTCGVVSLLVPRSVVKCFSRWATDWCNKKRWLVIAPTLRWAHYLKPSMQHMKNVRQQYYLLKLSILMMCSVMIAAIVISANGFAGYRTIERNDVERLKNTSVFEKPTHLLKQLHVPLTFAADSLFLMDEFSKDSPFSAEVLFSSIARVVTASPDITVDRIAWISLEGVELFETLTHGTTAVAPRASVVETDVSNNVQVQIEGFVSVAALARQKSKLDSFVGELEKLPSVKAVRVLESPLDSALSSGAQPNEEGQYRLSLLLSNKQ